MTSTVWITVIVGAVLTFAMRAVFPLFADRADDLSPRVRTILSMIPPAALAALAVPPFLRVDGQITLISVEVLAGLVASAVAWRTKNMLATLIAGFAVLLAFG